MTQSSLFDQELTYVWNGRLNFLSKDICENIPYSVFLYLPYLFMK